MLSGLRDILNTVDAQVLIRLAIDTGRHAVRYLDAIVAAPTEPPGWKPMVWEYQVATLVAGQTSSRAFAAALDPDDAQTLAVGGFNLTFPVLSGLHGTRRARTGGRRC
jgi:hypothetical protein